MKLYNPTCWSLDYQDLIRTNFMLHMRPQSAMTLDRFQGQSTMKQIRVTPWDEVMRPLMTIMRYSGADELLCTRLKSSLEEITEFSPRLGLMAHVPLDMHCPLGSRPIMWHNYHDRRIFSNYNVLFAPSTNLLRGPVYQMSDTQRSPLPEGMCALLDQDMAVVATDKKEDVPLYAIVKKLLHWRDLPPQPGEGWVHRYYDVLDTAPRWRPVSLKVGKLLWLRVLVLDSIELSPAKNRESCYNCKQPLRDYSAAAGVSEHSLGFVAYGIGKNCLDAQWLILQRKSRP